MVYYFDSSALVKRYIEETGSAWVSQLGRSYPSSHFYTVRITGAEIVAAMFVRMRTGSIAVPEAQTAVHQFKTDFRQRYQIIEVTPDLIELAMSLAERHAIRGYDSVQLAAALSLQRVRASLELPALTFVSADNRLNSVAEAESLLVENPNDKK